MSGLRVPGRRVDREVMRGRGFVRNVPTHGIEGAVCVDGGATVLAKVLTPRLDHERLDELPWIGQITEQAPSVRAGASVAQLVALFDGTVDYVLKDGIIAALAQVDTPESTTKLLAIAKTDESVTARKRAISALAQSADPKVRQALAAMAERGNK